MPVDIVIHSRPNITLTDHQLGLIQRRLPAFRNAKVDKKTRIIQEITNSVKNSWGEDQPKFIRKQVETVCAPSAKPNYSHMALLLPL